MTIEHTPQHFVMLAAHFPPALQKDLVELTADLGFGLIPTDTDSFISGERHCELFPHHRPLFAQNKKDIEGAHVHIVMSMEQDPNAFFVDTLNAIETIKDYNPAHIHVILPFVPYARQDRDFENRFVSKMGLNFPKYLKAAGANTITTCDVHSKAAEDAYITHFGEQNVQFLSMVPYLYEAAKELIPEHAQIKVGAPDGADKPHDMAQQRAHDFATLLTCNNTTADDHMFFISKTHEGVNKTRVTGFKGDVTDAYAIEVDDMTDTGGTLVNGAETLKQYGAQKVIAAVTHPIFSGETLRDLTCDAIHGRPNGIDFIVTSDSITSIHRKRDKLSPMRQERVKIVSTVPLIKKALTHNFK
jgi:ribose-phosphate pyrophosphokinase